MNVLVEVDDVSVRMVTDTMIARSGGKLPARAEVRESLRLRLRDFLMHELEQQASGLLLDAYQNWQPGQDMALYKTGEPEGEGDDRTTDPHAGGDPGHAAGMA